MTCIIALRTPNKMLMAADRCLTYDQTFREVSNLPKIIKLSDNVLIGGAGNCHEGSLVDNYLELPENSYDSNYKYVVKGIVPVLKTIMASNNVLGHELECHRMDANFLITVDNEIFRIAYDYGITCHKSDYTVIGTGRNYALGSLATTDGFEECFGMTSQARLMLALESSERFCPEVMRPFDILEVNL